MNCIRLGHAVGFEIGDNADEWNHQRIDNIRFLDFEQHFVALDGREDKKFIIS